MTDSREPLGRLPPESPPAESPPADDVTPEELQPNEGTPAAPPLSAPVDTAEQERLEEERRRAVRLLKTRDLGEIAERYRLRAGSGSERDARPEEQLSAAQQDFDAIRRDHRDVRQLVAVQVPHHEGARRCVQR